MMTRDQIQTVLNALQNSQLFVQASSNINVLEGFGQQLDDADEAIALLRAFLAEPSEPVYIRRDQLQKARRQAYLCEVGPEPRKDKVAVFTHPAPNKPLEFDKDLIQALTERDEYHDMADKLAEGIALHFDGDIGEHSSSNSPWDRALDLLDSAACAETMRLSKQAALAEPSEPEPLRDDEVGDIARGMNIEITLDNEDTLLDFARAIESAVWERGFEMSIEYAQGWDDAKAQVTTDNSATLVNALAEIERLSIALTQANKAITTVAADGQAAIERKDAALLVALSSLDACENILPVGYGLTRVRALEAITTIKEAL